jgi:hypothetical protein
LSGFLKSEVSGYTSAGGAVVRILAPSQSFGGVRLNIGPHFLEVMGARRNLIFFWLFFKVLNYIVAKNDILRKSKLW